MGDTSLDRHGLGLGLLLAAGVLLAACSSGAGSMESSAAPVPSDASGAWAPTEGTDAWAPNDASDPRQLLGKPQTSTFTEEADGFTQVSTVTLYPGVDGRDADLLAAAWASVGGERELPCLDMTPSVLERAYVIFGTVSFRYEDTGGFTPPEFRWQFVRGWSKADKRFPGDQEEALNIVSQIGIEYSSETACSEPGGLIVSPKMDGAMEWGPTPIVIVNNGFYGPKNPTGQPAFLKYALLCSFLSRGECARFPRPTAPKQSSATGADPRVPALVATIDTLDYPYRLAVSPDGSRVYVAEGRGVSVIDAARNEIVEIIDTVDLPQRLAVSPDGSRVYAAIEGGAVMVIDAASNEIVATFDVGVWPKDLVVSPDGSRVYVAGGSRVSVIDAARREVIATVELGLGDNNVDSLAVSPDGSRVYVTTDNRVVGAVVAIDAVSNEVAATVATVIGGYSLEWALSPDGSRVYVADPGRGTVVVSDAARNEVLATIAVGDPLVRALAVSPDGSRVYVTTGDGAVVVIDAASYEVVATIDTGPNSGALGVSPDGSGVFVATSNVTTGNQELSVIDAARNEVVAIVDAGGYVDDLVVAPTGSRVYVTESIVGQVRVFDAS